MYKIDEMDKRILMILQRGIPITSRPYLAMAEELGNISEDEVISRIDVLKKENIIRRMSGFFNSRKLGYVSVLCAIEVEETKIDEVSELINKFPGITHNYLRQNKYNMWFTVIAIDQETLDKIVDIIDAHPAVKRVMRFYTGHRFKIDVTFDLGVK